MKTRLALVVILLVLVVDLASVVVLAQQPAGYRFPEDALPLPNSNNVVTILRGISMFNFSITSTLSVTPPGTTLIVEDSDFTVVTLLELRNTTGHQQRISLPDHGRIVFRNCALSFNTYEPKILNFGFNSSIEFINCVLKPSHFYADGTVVTGSPYSRYNTARAIYLYISATTTETSVVVRNCRYHHTLSPALRNVVSSHAYSFDYAIRVVFVSKCQLTANDVPPVVLPAHQCDRRFIFSGTVVVVNNSFVATEGLQPIVRVEHEPIWFAEAGAVSETYWYQNLGRRNLQRPRNASTHAFGRFINISHNTVWLTSVPNVPHTYLDAEDGLIGVSATVPDVTSSAYRDGVIPIDIPHGIHMDFNNFTLVDVLLAHSFDMMSCITLGGGSWYSAVGNASLLSVSNNSFYFDERPRWGSDTLQYAQYDSHVNFVRVLPITDTSLVRIESNTIDIRFAYKVTALSLSLGNPHESVYQDYGFPMNANIGAVSVRYNKIKIHNSRYYTAIYMEVMRRIENISSLAFSDNTVFASHVNPSPHWNNHPNISKINNHDAGLAGPGGYCMETRSHDGILPSEALIFAVNEFLIEDNYFEMSGQAYLRGVTLYHQAGNVKLMRFSGNTVIARTATTSRDGGTVNINQVLSRAGLESMGGYYCLRTFNLHVNHELIVMEGNLCHAPEIAYCSESAGISLGYSNEHAPAARDGHFRKLIIRNNTVIMHKVKSQTGELSYVGIMIVLNWGRLKWYGLAHVYNNTVLLSVDGNCPTTSCSAAKFDMLAVESTNFDGVIFENNSLTIRHWGGVANTFMVSGWFQTDPQLTSLKIYFGKTNITDVRKVHFIGNSAVIESGGGVPPESSTTTHLFISFIVSGFIQFGEILIARNSFAATFAPSSTVGANLPFSTQVGAVAFGCPFGRFPLSPFLNVDLACGSTADVEIRTLVVEHNDWSKHVYTVGPLINVECGFRVTESFAVRDCNIALGPFTTQTATAAAAQSTTALFLRSVIRVAPTTGAMSSFINSVLVVNNSFVVNNNLCQEKPGSLAQVKANSGVLFLKDVGVLDGITVNNTRADFGCAAPGSANSLVYAVYFAGTSSTATPAQVVFGAGNNFAVVRGGAILSLLSIHRGAAAAATGNNKHFAIRISQTSVTELIPSPRSSYVVAEPKFDVLGATSSSSQQTAAATTTTTASMFIGCKTLWNDMPVGARSTAVRASFTSVADINYDLRCVFAGGSLTRSPKPTKSVSHPLSLSITASDSQTATAFFTREPPGMSAAVLSSLDTGSKTVAVVSNLLSSNPTLLLAIARSGQLIALAKCAVDFAEKVSTPSDEQVFFGANFTQRVLLTSLSFPMSLLPPVEVGSNRVGASYRGAITLNIIVVAVAFIVAWYIGTIFRSMWRDAVGKGMVSALRRKTTKGNYGNKDDFHHVQSSGEFDQHQQQQPLTETTAMQHAPIDRSVVKVMVLLVPFWCEVAGALAGGQPNGAGDAVLGILPIVVLCLYSIYLGRRVFQFASESRPRGESATTVSLSQQQQSSVSSFSRELSMTLNRSNIYNNSGSTADDFESTGNPIHDLLLFGAPNSIARYKENSSRLLRRNNNSNSNINVNRNERRRGSFDDAEREQGRRREETKSDTKDKNDDTSGDRIPLNYVEKSDVFVPRGVMSDCSQRIRTMLRTPVGRFFFVGATAWHNPYIELAHSTMHNGPGPLTQFAQTIQHYEGPMRLQPPAPSATQETKNNKKKASKSSGNKSRRRASQQSHRSFDFSSAEADDLDLCSDNRRASSPTTTSAKRQQEREQLEQLALASASQFDFSLRRRLQPTWIYITIVITAIAVCVAGSATVHPATCKTAFFVVLVLVLLNACIFLWLRPYIVPIRWFSGVSIELLACLGGIVLLDGVVNASPTYPATKQQEEHQQRLVTAGQLLCSLPGMILGSIAAASIFTRVIVLRLGRITLAPLSLIRAEVKRELEVLDCELLLATVIGGGGGGQGRANNTSNNTGSSKKREERREDDADMSWML